HTGVARGRERSDSRLVATVGAEGSRTAFSARGARIRAPTADGCEPRTARQRSASGAATARVRGTPGAPPQPAAAAQGDSARPGLGLHTATRLVADVHRIPAFQAHR